MQEMFGVVAAMLLNSVGGAFVFRHPVEIPVMAWLWFLVVAAGQIGFDLTFSGPEPWAFLKFAAVNIAIGFFLSLAVKKLDELQGGA